MSVAADLPDWLASASKSRSFRVEVCFSIADSVYFGPKNRFTPKQWTTLREELPISGLPVEDGFMTVTNADAHFEALTAYLQNLVSVAKRRGVALAGSQHGWMRPRIIADAKTICSFIGYRDYLATKGVLGLLSADRQGSLLSDLDEHWEIELFRLGDDVYFGERDGDSETPPRTCREAWLTVSREAQKADTALDSLIEKIRATVDIDLWRSDI